MKAESIHRTRRIRAMFESACEGRHPAKVMLTPTPFPHEEKGWAVRFRKAGREERRSWVDFEILSTSTSASELKTSTAVSVGFSSLLVGGYCHFQSSVLKYSKTKGILRLAFPKLIERFQRRVVVRIEPPIEAPLYAEFQIRGKTYRETVRSLSVKGIGVRLHGKPPFLPAKLLSKLRIVFADGSLLVEHEAIVQEIILSGKDAFIASIVFVDFNLKKEQAVRDYMISTLKL